MRDNIASSERSNAMHKSIWEHIIASNHHEPFDHAFFHLIDHFARIDRTRRTAQTHALHIHGMPKMCWPFPDRPIQERELQERIDVFARAINKISATTQEK